MKYYWSLTIHVRVVVVVADVFLQARDTARLGYSSYGWMLNDKIISRVRFVSRHIKRGEVVHQNSS